MFIYSVIPNIFPELLRILILVDVLLNTAYVFINNVVQSFSTISLDHFYIVIRAVNENIIIGRHSPERIVIKMGMDACLLGPDF